MNETLHRILLVEDEPDLRRGLKRELEATGFVVFEAKNGEDALRLATTNHPDLILLDIIMPKMDGLEVLKALRMDDWGKSADIILLTNLLDHAKIAQAAELGVHDYLVKIDWTINDIVQKIQERFSKKT